MCEKTDSVDSGEGKCSLSFFVVVANLCFFVNGYKGKINIK